MCVNSVDAQLCFPFTQTVDGRTILVASMVMISVRKISSANDYHNGVCYWALAFFVEAAVVGGVVDYAVGSAVFDVHGGGAATVEVDGIDTAQPPHQVG